MKKRILLWSSGWIATIFCVNINITQCASADMPPPEIKTTSNWKVQNDGKPILRINDLRKQALWNDPCVRKLDDGTLAMYMTSSTKEIFQPPVLPFRAVSNDDGRNWKLSPKTPLLEATGTPFNSIETPSVVKFKGVWHMYYTGTYAAGSKNPMAIGHATSTDGIKWKHDPAGAVIAATNEATNWRSYLVGEPGAVVHNDKIYVYFSAVGARIGGKPPQSQTIGLATSSDGSKFKDHQVVLKQTSEFSAKRSFAGYSTPSVLKHKGKIHLFHDVAHFNKGGDPSWRQVALCHASSDDGIKFKQKNSAILTTKSLTWTASEIRSPSVLMHKGKAHMWFAGHGDLRTIINSLATGTKSDEFGIGHAIADSL